MKKFLISLIFIVIIGAILYQFRYDLQTYIEPYFDKTIDQIANKNIPCQKPITYSIGTFDKQFGISQAYFMEALYEAETIWEKSLGRELFAYKEIGADMKINLSYDYRQQATDKLADLGINVKDDKASYNTLKAKYTALNDSLVNKKNDYENKVIDFNKKQKIYEEKVKYWNNQNGAPKNEYDILQNEKSVLDKEIISLQFLQKQINEMVDEINALSVILNHLANVLNLSADQFNAINKARGESFEEGVYQSDGINREIVIYEFSSREKLVRVLAHELGHALGIDHVDDSKAIMYKLNQNNSQIPTKDDLLALEKLCGMNK